MPALPGPAPRSPALELLVEQVARVVARARAQQGDDAVRDRVASTITPHDAEVAARVLRTLGRELGDAPVDLGALDARLRTIAGADPAAPGTPEGGSEADAADTRAGDAHDAPGAPGRRPPPPTGLRSAMRRRRR